MKKGFDKQKVTRPIRKKISRGECEWETEVEGEVRGMLIKVRWSPTFLNQESCSDAGLFLSYFFLV